MAVVVVVVEVVVEVEVVVVAPVGVVVAVAVARMTLWKSQDLASACIRVNLKETSMSTRNFSKSLSLVRCFNLDSISFRLLLHHYTVVLSGTSDLILL